MVETQQVASAAILAESTDLGPTNEVTPCGWARRPVAAPYLSRGLAVVAALTAMFPATEGWVATPAGLAPGNAPAKARIAYVGHLLLADRVKQGNSAPLALSLNRRLAY